MATFPSSTPLVVLLADDDRSTRLILRMVLQKEGYEVVETENGALCLEAFMNRKPDIVILDAQMPVMDGFECCKRLKQLPFGDRIPVIMLTGLQTPRDMDAAFQAGVADFVSKPVHPPLLSRRLHYILKSAQSEIALRESEERYRLVVDNLQEVIFQTDLEGRFSFLNPAWTAITGFAQDSAIGQPLLDYIYPDDGPKLAHALHEMALSQLPHLRTEARFMTADGNIGWMDLYISPLMSREDTIVSMSGSFSQITERKSRQLLDKLEYSVVQVLAESMTLAEALSNLLPVMGQAMAWEQGELWQLNPVSKGIDCVEQWHSQVGSVKVPEPYLSEEEAHHFWTHGTYTLVANLFNSVEGAQGLTCALTPRSVIVIPILGGDACLGMIVFVPTSRFLGDASLLKCLDSIGAQLNTFILRKLAEEEVARYHDQMCHELRQAADYIRALLPPSLSGTVSIRHLFVPSSDLGGDIFDYYWLDPDHLVVYLVDVAGHGVQSALLSISILNVMRSRSLQNDDYYVPAKVLQALNHIFQMDMQGNNYFTMWYGVYDRVQRTLTYACAGHPPALLLAANGEVQKLSTGGIAIGLLPEIDYEQGVHEIGEGNCLYLFSDGVYEIPQDNGQVWGFEAFAQLVADEPQPQPDQLESIFSQISHINRSKAFEDDFSLIQLKFNGEESSYFVSTEDHLRFEQGTLSKARS
ncbi:MAG TPA: SpoIIE family protein phosphatase [Stenomitos sp.]